MDVELYWYLAQALLRFYAKYFQILCVDFGGESEPGLIEQNAVCFELIL